MINWSVRIKNKTFWVTIIPCALLLIKQILAIFGIEVEIGNLSNQLVEIIGTVFAILSLLGVVVDHTTEGIKDSARAMSYNEPF